VLHLKQIKKVTEDNFISGIYNHCDRWCERCSFTDRCKVFYEERKQLNALENQDDFLAIVSQNLGNVKQMLQKMAEERGIDLENLKDDGTYEQHQQKTNESRQHPLSQNAMSYAQHVHKWLEDLQHLEPYKQKLLKNIDLGIDLDESDKALRRIDEALNIIRWYLFQIPVKIPSALRYYPHDSSFEDELNNMHHASAKIAIIGIENSMKSWQILLDLIDEEEEFILETLLLLQQLHSKIHRQFPLLHKYKRPYFGD